MNDIQRFSSEFVHTPIMVTSRVVGYLPQRLRDAEFRHFMLHDLDAHQIAAFVDRWHAETFESEEQAAPKRERLKKAIRDSKSIAMLAGNPLLLTMMAILNRNQELPRDRADLYTQASRVLLHQWDTERALMDFPGLRADVGLREKTEILRRVAFHMQAGPGGLKGNLIDGETLAGLIENYLRDELHFNPARAAARAVVEHLRLRNFILCFVGADSYAFVHRTFLEYFCAAEFVHRFNIAKSLDIEGLIALFDEHCRQDEWREVLRLICAQIDESFVGRIVARLATRTDLEKWDGETPLPELPLAIGCLSEIRTIGKVEETGGLLLGAVFRLFRKETLTLEEDFLNELLAVSREVGARWPGTTKLPSDLSLPSAEGWHHVVWPKFLAWICSDRNLILPLVSCDQSTVRWGAVEALAEKWPDDETRALLAQRAVQDDDDRVRRVALRALAEKWPDEATHALLTTWTTEAPHPDVRSAALQTLADKWPDEATHALLAQRAVQDDNYEPRRTALQALADKWPDEKTRALLAQRAVQDENYQTRSTALQALAKKWPDDATRSLLAASTTEGPHPGVRSTALQALVAKWPDEATHALLAQRAVQDDNYAPRTAALQALAAKWPDEATRALLAQRAVQDDNYEPRRTALRALAEKWPDEKTRTLLAQQAVQDDDGGSRSTALQALAAKWPDEATRALLAQRAVQDDNYAPRSAALQALAGRWPDEATHALLAQRAVQDLHNQVRSAAFFGLGKMHSPFGRILATRDLDGAEPYLDPLRPISRDHIEKAAKKTAVRPDEIDAQVASLSAYLGWDVTRGAKPPG